MVKKVVRAGAEIIKIKGPAAQRNGEAHFMLLISLTAQRQEADPLADRQVKERSGHGVDWWSLIEAAIVATNDPFELGNLYRNAHARVADILLHKTGKMGKPDPTIHRQPSGQLVLIFNIKGYLACGSPLLLTQRLITAVVCYQGKQRGIVLSKARKASFEIMPTLHNTYRNFRPAIKGRSIVSGGENIDGAALKCCAVEMQKRRGGKHHARSERMDP